MDLRQQVLGLSKEYHDIPDGDATNGYPKTQISAEIL